MELRQLHHFLAVVQAGSISGAAASLGLTQQAVSKSVRALEASVGVELFVRSGGRLAPNAHGTALAGKAEVIIAGVRDLEATLCPGAADRGPRLRIGSSPTATAPVVTPAVLGLLRENGTLRVDVATGLRRELLGQLERGLLDLAVCLDIERQHSPALVREVLCSDEYAVFAGARNPLGRRDDLTAADLAGRPWLLGRNLGDVAAAWAAAWDRARLPPPTPVIETTSLEFCRQALATGPYLTILPRGLVAGDVNARRLQVIPVVEFAWERPIALYVRRATPRTPALRAIIAALRVAASNWGT